MAKRKSNRRKESKKIEEVVSTDTNIVDKLLIAGGVLLFILAFYGLTLYITNKNADKEDTEEEKTVEVSNEYIILGRSLSMSDNDYYVLYFDKSNSDELNTYDEIVTRRPLDDVTIYKVDMSSAFNKKYKTDSDSNKSPSKASEFKINGPTLIKVSNKKVVDYIEGEEAIRSYLN